MLIDCDACVAQNVACEDCVVTFLLAAPSGGVGWDGGVGWSGGVGWNGGVDWDDDERRALAALAEGGLIRMPRRFRAA
ncbi:hypothetical protein UG55_1006262 [Frankia sp. EI5c]|uniref:hypothetical protein n=1 Tax=Frankia sp. EI5c TaxID=683316 RepID=UPI0007C350B3|nr:hypothetical protein [Frankia sp. EI5c]OAA28287.1 hypothetical protein UG55_1006262 [Frankia sp. EI5c]